MAEVRSLVVTFSQLSFYCYHIPITATLHKKVCKSIEGTLKELGCRKHSKTVVEGDVGVVNKYNKNILLMPRLRTTRQSRALKQIGENDVKIILEGIAENLNELDRDDLKEILRGMIDRVVYDHSTEACCIHYKIPVKSRDLVASPT